MTDRLHLHVTKGIEDRIKHRALNHCCPVCDEPGLVPFGSPRAYWFECACGAFSPMKDTLDEALGSELESWRVYLSRFAR